MQWQFVYHIKSDFFTIEIEKQRQNKAENHILFDPLVKLIFKILKIQ